MKNLTPCTDCKGNCSRCGNCCTIAIPITRAEETTIREYIKEHNVEPVSLFEGNNFYMYCCFYDRKEKKCNIYDVRPEICRSFKCNRNWLELEKEKRENHRKAYWNHMDKHGNLSNFTTFDLLFYDDPRPLLNMIFQTYRNEYGEIDKKQYKKIITNLKKWGQGELVKHMTPVFKKENKNEK